MPDAPARDAIVLRFPPGGPEHVKRIRNEAKWTHRKHQVAGQAEEPWYRLSLWVDSAREDESQHELRLRLEPEEHWSVDLGPEPPSVDVVRNFVNAFVGPEGTETTG